MKDLILNNGTTAAFKYEDDFSRPVYLMPSKSLACCVDLNGTNLHTITREGEPNAPLKEEYQPCCDAADMYKYLEELRVSGEINMMGAAPYLIHEFGFATRPARTALLNWMKES